MITDTVYWRGWEDDLCRSQPADYERNLCLVETLREEAALLGVFPQDDLLANIPAKTRRGADDFVRRTLVLPCREENTGIRIDMIFAQSAYEQQALCNGCVVCQWVRHRSVSPP